MGYPLAAGHDVAVFPKVTPPLARGLAVSTVADAFLRRSQLCLPVGDSALQAGQRDVEAHLLLRLLRDIHPPLVVAAGIVPVGLAHEHKSLSAHASAEDEVPQGIIQAIFHGIHALLADSGVEDGLRTVQVHEGDTLVSGHNAVGTGLQALGCSKLITGLEALTLGELNITGPPILVGSSHHLPDLGTVDVDMDYRLADISPQLDAGMSVSYLDIAFVEVQNLTEVLHIEARRKADAETPLLEQGVVLVETSGARHIEHDVAFLHPYIHPNVAASARHRPAGVLAGRAPLVVLGLTKSLNRQKN